jgi:hypothetical protein
MIAIPHKWYVNSIFLVIYTGGNMSSCSTTTSSVASAHTRYDNEALIYARFMTSRNPLLPLFMSIMPGEEISQISEWVQKVCPHVLFSTQRGGTHLVVLFIFFSTQRGGTYLLVVLFVCFSMQRGGTHLLVVPFFPFSTHQCT